jgi:hypothetical protein
VSARDPFEVLGLPRDATPEQIKTRYETLMYALDRDSGGASTPRSQEVVAAYMALKSEDGLWAPGLGPISAVPEDRSRRLYGLLLCAAGALAMAAGAAVLLETRFAWRLRGLLGVDETGAFFLFAAGGAAVAWGLGKSLWSAKEEAESDRLARRRRGDFF